jgi:histone H3/H4
MAEVSNTTLITINNKKMKLKYQIIMKDFPLFPLEKILKKAGKEVGADRVSESAVVELKNIMLEMAEKIALDALVAARHAKRVTVRREDVQMAVR